MKVYERRDGKLEKLPESAKRINVLEVLGKDGKRYFVEKYETVRLFGQNRIFAETKDGRVYEIERTKARLAEAYKFEIRRKVKDKNTNKEKEIPTTVYIDVDLVYSVNK